MKDLKIIIIAVLFFVLGAGASVYFVSNVKENKKAYSQRRAEKEREEQEKRDASLAQQLVGIWAPPPTYATYQGRTVKMVAFCRMKVEANGAKVNTTCLGTPSSTYDLSETWYSPTNLPYIDAYLRNGRLVGTKNVISYGAGGAFIYNTEPYDAGIEMSPEGNSFIEMPKDGKEVKWLKE